MGKLSFTRGASSGTDVRPPELKSKREKMQAISPRKAIVKFAVNVTLESVVRQLDGGRAAFIDAIRRNPDAEEFVERHDVEIANRRTVTLDGLCVALEIDPAEVFGWFSKACWQNQLDMVSLIKSQATSAMPRILQSSIQLAEDVYEGHDERKVLFEMVGLISRRGIAIQNNLVNQNPVEPVADQSFEGNARNIASIVREKHRELPPREVDEPVDAESVEDPCTIPR